MVEVVQRNNQYLKGKSEAFRGFRDCLAKEIVRGMPGVEGRVKEVLEGKVVGEEKDVGAGLREEVKMNGNTGAR